MMRMPGAERYQRYIKYLLSALILSFLVWFTPHTLFMTAQETKAIGGAQHPVIGNFGVMSAKNGAINLMIVLSSLSYMLHRRANRTITAKWWWPTGIDSLQVYGVMSGDLLTSRSDNPDQMTISKPKVRDGTLEFTVKEVFTEVGQDRILGKGKKTSIVEVIPENGRWVIDEVTSSITDAYGDTRVDTLSQLLLNATQTLRDTENAIKKLPQKLEVRKGQALRQSSQHQP